MGSIIVQAGERAQTMLRLQPGQEISFGRGARDLPVDLLLDDPAVSRLAGQIHAVEDYWRLSNLSRWATYVVENPEGGGEFVKVPPGRLRAPIAFEISRVVLPVWHGTLTFTVMAPEQSYAHPHEEQSGDRTDLAHSLDPTAKYFLVLVALCEPRLRDPSSPMIPTVPEILQRLHGHNLTRSGVNFHIDYLAREKLRVKTPDGRKADWQRAALVSTALRFNLIREEHLDLLPRTP